MQIEAVRADPSRRPLSLALRITASAALATMLMLVLFAWQVSRSLDHHFALQDLGELQAMTQSLARALNTPVERDHLTDGQPGAGASLARRLAGAVMGHHACTSR